MSLTRNQFPIYGCVMTHTDTLNAHPEPLVQNPDGSVEMTSAEVAMVLEMAARLDVADDIAFFVSLEGLLATFATGALERFVNPEDDTIYYVDWTSGLVHNITTKYQDWAVYIEDKMRAKDIEDQILAAERQIEHHLAAASQAVTAAFNEIDNIMFGARA